MSTPPKLFSYVVDHDHGLSPNPTGGFCTLAFCKYSTSSKPNIVELAQEGDWVIGTGGASASSAGHGRLVYAMKVTKKMTLRDYFRDPRFMNRAGNDYSVASSTDRFALVSDHFFYFGSKAPRLAKQHTDHPKHPIEKRGPHYRSRFGEDFITDFVTWLEKRYKNKEWYKNKPSIYGPPCDPEDDEWYDSEPCGSVPKCSPRPKGKC